MLGARIAALRCRQGLTQAALAERLSVSASTVGMYEHGRRTPSVNTLIALSREFGVTVEYLLTGHICSQQDCIALSEMLTNAQCHMFSEANISLINSLTGENLAALIAAQFLEEK